MFGKADIPSTYQVTFLPGVVLLSYNGRLIRLRKKCVFKVIASFCSVENKGLYSSATKGSEYQSMWVFCGAILFNYTPDYCLPELTFCDLYIVIILIVA